MDRKILIVDDNDRYANALEAFYKKYNFDCCRAYHAREGWQIYQQNPTFFSIVTDITMESQTSGLWLSRKIYSTGFKGYLLIATTGFDFPGVMFCSKYLLPWFSGIDWMIPKKPIRKEGSILFFPTQKQINQDYITLIKGTKAGN
jgi:CheY-like chemotaxis protein